MKKINNVIFILLISTISITIYCLNKDNDIAIILDLESDDNDNNSNRAIPELGGQMPESPNAFDNEANRNIRVDDDGTFDDLDVSIEFKIKEQLVAALLNNDRVAVKKILHSYESPNEILLDILMDPRILKILMAKKGN